MSWTNEKGFRKRSTAEREWDKVRAQLKIALDKLNIRFCEKCGKSGPTANLRFGHRYKRRFITTEAELRMAALLCEKCDTDLEFGGHERMFNEITEIIENRKEVWCEPA